MFAMLFGKLHVLLNSREYEETQVIATVVHILLPTIAEYVLFHQRGTRNRNPIKVFPPSNILMNQSFCIIQNNLEGEHSNSSMVSLL